jgi:NtrC-family two-component system sensor histidine kinase KinB
VFSIKKKSLHLPGTLAGYLFLGFIAIILGLFLYFQTLVREVRDSTKVTSKIFAEFLKTETTAYGVYPKPNPEMEIIFKEVIKNIDFPVIITDERGVPRVWRNVRIDPASISNDMLENIDPENPPEGPVKRLIEITKRLDRENEPIPMVYGGSVHLGTVHYGETALVKQLKWFPVIISGVIIVFLIVGFLGFSIARRSDEEHIWVGLAKETAHQLGTPLSSLMGWTEILREKNPPDIIEGLEKDVARLQKVTNRFSSIGQLPKLKKGDINNVVKDSVDYLKQKLPTLDNKIEIIERYNAGSPVEYDYDLFSWVIENLVKNAIDAINVKKGVIEIDTKDSSNAKYVEIRVRDNGRGIPKNEAKRIFEAGFTSKQFGWGLGLAITRRIVDDYHDGRILLEGSHIGKGSTFLIYLPIVTKKKEAEERKK